MGFFLVCYKISVRNCIQSLFRLHGDFFLHHLSIFIFCLVFKKKLRLPLYEIKHIAIQGILLFSINYFFIYWGTNFVTSGLVAILFSTVSVFVIFNGYFFFNKDQ